MIGFFAFLLDCRGELGSPVRLFAAPRFGELGGELFVGLGVA